LWKSEKRQLLLVMDATSLGNRLPDFGDQRGHEGLCHSGGLETAPSATARLMASVEWISRWVPTPGTSWQGQVECFASKKGRFNGTRILRLPTRL
jgi:hypothetical protein